MLHPRLGQESSARALPPPARPQSPGSVSERVSERDGAAREATAFGCVDSKRATVLCSPLRRPASGARVCLPSVNRGVGGFPLGSRVGAQVPEQKLALGPESPIGWDGSAGSGRAGGVMDAPVSTAAESEPGLQMEGQTDGRAKDHPSPTPERPPCGGVCFPNGFSFFLFVPFIS